MCNVLENGIFMLPQFFVVKKLLLPSMRRYNEIVSEMRFAREKKISQWFALYLKRIWHVFGLSAVKYDHVASFHQASKGLAGLIFFLPKSLTRQSCKCKVTRKVGFDRLLSSFTSSQGKILFVTWNSPYTWMDSKPRGRHSFTI